MVYIYTCTSTGNAKSSGIFGKPYSVTSFSVQFKEIYPDSSRVTRFIFFSDCIFETFSKVCAPANHASGFAAP